MGCMLMLKSKSPRFLVDVGVGKKVQRWLSANGYDVKCVRDIDPAMQDDKILRIAASENRMVVTMDKDFGQLVYRAGLTHSGVLLLRLEDANGAEKAQAVEHILRNYSSRIVNRFCVFQNGKLRIRK